MNFPLTGVLVCYDTWDELDKIHDRVTKLNMAGVKVLKAYNNNAGVPYPWTLAFIIRDDGLSMDQLDNDLCAVDLGANADGLYVGRERIEEFLKMMILGKYVPGVLKVRFGRCDLKALNELACMFCQFGHMLECHYPDDCIKAKCSHLERYDLS